MDICRYAVIATIDTINLHNAINTFYPSCTLVILKYYIYHTIIWYMRNNSTPIATT